MQQLWQVNSPMRKHVRLDGLLFSTDTQILSLMNQTLDSFAIETEVFAEIGPALDALAHRRLDVVIVDWNAAKSPTRVVRAARKSSPNSNSTIVAMVNGSSEMQAALLAGANFTIHKPTSHDDAIRCMRAAYGTMLQQRRRTARCTVDIRVVSTIAEVGCVEARLTDISIGGLALQCDKPLEIHSTVSLSFSLPATSQLIHVTGRVVNSIADADGRGRIGICFSSVSEDDFNLLVNWLADELAKLDNIEIPMEDLAAN
jgi:DNA-binding response OmpR family regulator